MRTEKDREEEGIKRKDADRKTIKKRTDMRLSLIFKNTSY